jgi:hypothetical protein
MDELELHVYENHSQEEQLDRGGGRGVRDPGVGGRGPLCAAAGGGLSRELVDDAVNRARVRSAVGELGGGRLSDGVIDELLAGASTEEEIVGPGGCWRS